MKTNKRSKEDQPSLREQTHIGRYLPFEMGGQQSFPDDVNEQILLVCMEAESFAQKCCRLPPDHAVMIGKRRLSSIIEPGQANACSEMLRAVFWGVSSAHTRNVNNRPITSVHTPSALGGKSQSALTRAFLLMTDEQREDTRNCLINQPKHVVEEWIGDCVGAFAVARAAYQLLSRRVPTILPKRKIDAFSRIDLIGKINRFDPIHLCFQIKRASIGVPSTLVFLEDQSFKDQSEDLQFLRRDMTRFAEKYTLRCLPMILWVGDDDVGPWDIRGGQTLNQLMDDLIEYTRFMD